MVPVFRNKGLAFKLSFFILTSCTAIFAVIFSYNYGISRGIIIEKIEENAKNLTLSTVNRIESVVRPAEKAPVYLAHILENSRPDKNEVVEMLRAMLENNPEIYGTTIAFEPYAYDKDLYYFAPYFYRKDGKLVYADLGIDSYKYFEWEWYTAPKKLSRPVWSEPYFDEGGGNVLMTTYSVPFYREVNGKRTFTGVVTADLSLSWLQEVVSSIKIAQTGYGFLISKKGTVITHPDKGRILRDNIFDLAEAGENATLLDIAAGIKKNGFGFGPVRGADTGKKSWVAYAPVPTTGWGLAILFPRDEVMKDITSLNRAVFILGLAGVFFLFVVIILIAGSITRPLRVLAHKTRDIAEGNLDFDLPVMQSRDEVGNLTEAFIYMKDSLKKYIDELTKTTVEKERIESELKIAHDIQMGILPKVFPPFPERPEFDIYAALKPAKEVGGDFYDFYFIDNDCLFFTIGDVSGKGVPAALLMALTKTFIKIVANIVGDPRDVLRRINEELARDNESQMFVTIFCGILNIRTGKVCYSNAGHNPPLVIQKGGVPEFLKCETGTAAGVFEGAVFADEDLDLSPGDTVYLYTDGVTEAVNKDTELFSEGRLKEKLSSQREDPIKEIVEGTMRGIADFAQGMPQSDDITVVVLRYFGGDEGGISATGKE